MTWIKCSERMPDASVRVLIAWTNDRVEISYWAEFSGKAAWVGRQCQISMEPSHWQLLPDPPKEAA
jgi:hypothetical protein